MAQHAKARVVATKAAKRAARKVRDCATVKKPPVHHICTNKNCLSFARGGPWTPRFQALFDKAGMHLNHGLNKIAIPGHKGPHPEMYHKAIFQRSEGATNGLSGDAYRRALQSELTAIRQEIVDPRSVLNHLVRNP
jgi:hypothetical protein